VINRFSGRYGFLSNFHKHQDERPMVWVPLGYGLDSDDEGVWMPTLEHGFVVLKVGCWEQFQFSVYDVSGRTISLDEYRSMSPGQAKRLGRRIKLRQDWDEVKVDVMLGLLRQKFGGPILAAELLATGERTLIEGNHWHDNFWGKCYCRKCCQKEHKNTLGKLLMQIRDELRQQ
jgi:ribA/ribD-fused uncharacterized protein